VRGPDITALLRRIRENDDAARAELLSQLYDQLRKAAAALLRKEAPGHTLQSASLLNEALGRLLDCHLLENAPDRSYLFASIHKAMRQVLTDHARARAAAKRGGAKTRVALDDVLDRIAADWKLEDVIEVNDALDALEERSGRQRAVVDLKVFGCLSNREIADQLGISEPTVERDFRLARAFLSRRLAR
jgi:RNA polymerase sigma factor (TIGR02999 family)